MTARATDASSPAAVFVPFGSNASWTVSPGVLVLRNSPTCPSSPADTGICSEPFVLGFPPLKRCRTSQGVASFALSTIVSFCEENEVRLSLPLGAAVELVLSIPRVVPESPGLLLKLPLPDSKFSKMRTDDGIARVPTTPAAYRLSTVCSNAVYRSPLDPYGFPAFFQYSSEYPRQPGSLSYTNHDAETTLWLPATRFQSLRNLYASRTNWAEFASSCAALGLSGPTYRFHSVMYSGLSWRPKLSIILICSSKAPRKSRTVGPYVCSAMPSISLAGMLCSAPSSHSAPPIQRTPGMTPPGLGGATSTR